MFNIGKINKSLAINKINQQKSIHELYHECSMNATIYIYKTLLVTHPAVDN